MTAPLATLADLRLAARQRADRVNSTGVYTNAFVTDQELNTLINQGLFELYDLLVCSCSSYYFLQSYSFTTNGILDQYPLPPDLYELLGVDLQIAANATAANGYLTLRSFTMGDRNRFVFPNVQVTYGILTNLRYFLSGNQLWLQPRAGAGQTLRIWYAPRLAPLVDQATILCSSVVAGDKVSIQVSTTPQTAYVTVTAAAGTGTASATTFYIGSTNAYTATSLAACLNLAFPTSLVAAADVTTTNQVNVVGVNTQPLFINWNSTNATRLALTPYDRWSYVADGFGGWLEFVILSAAIKMLCKEESDTSAFDRQLFDTKERIKAMSKKRNPSSFKVLLTFSSDDEMRTEPCPEGSEVAITR